MMVNVWWAIGGMWLGNRSRCGGWFLCLSLGHRWQAALRYARAQEDGRDAARYRWLKAQEPAGLLSVAWRCKEACEHDQPDAAIDAAIAAAAQEGDGNGET